jgi:hypothetical protein
MASTSVTNFMESHSGISFHSVLLALYMWCFYRYTRCSFSDALTVEVPPIHPSGKYVTLAIEPRFRVSDIS